MDSFEPGDVVLHNDPYRGGAHIPEHSVIRPVFHEGELWGFVANVGHLAEIGGKAVGSFAADATEVFQEGLRIPPVKIVSRDENNMDLWRLIMANHRTPRNTWGDLNAQIGSLRVAERRVIELLDRYGAEFVTQAAEELMDYSERWMRAEISAIPDGSYEFTDWMEDDGVVDEPVQFHVTVTIDGDRMIVDWTGSAPQVRGPINATYGVTAGAVYNAVFHVTDSSIPKNSRRLPADPHHRAAGHAWRTSSTRARRSAATRRPTRSSSTWSPGALAPVMREKVAAAEGASACNFLFGGVHPKTGDYYANYHLEGCGWGAKDYDDGNDCTIVVNGNCRNTPVEIFETRYPLETVEYSLHPGLRRRRPPPRRPRHAPDHAHRARAPRSRPARSSTARRASSGPGASRAAARRLRRDPRQAQRRDRVPHVPGGLRHGLGLQVHEHRPAGGRRGAARRAGRRRLRRSAGARPDAVARDLAEGIVSRRGGPGALRLGRR